MNKLIFLGCLSKEKYPDTCENAIKIIKFFDEGYKVIDDAPCCGSLTHHVSSDDDLKKHVNEVNDWFKSNNISEIITICAGCYNYLTGQYKKYIPDFNIKIKHLVQFINEPQNLEKLQLKFPGKKLAVTYHDACHLKNADPKILEEPRNIINSIEGNILFTDMENNRELALCCGSGAGVYSCFKENSDYNSKLILEQAKKSKAKMILTACPFCYTALKRIKEENKKIRIPIMKFEDFILNLMEGVEMVY